MSEAKDTNSTLEVADQLLSRIERMAQTDADSSAVWSQILDALRLLTRCKSAALAVPFGETWRVVQSNGESQSSVFFFEQILQQTASFNFTDELRTASGGGLFGAFPVGPPHNPAGVLLLHFSGKSSELLGQNVRTLAEAFAEIGYVCVTKQQLGRAQERISGLNLMVSQVGNTATFRELDQVIVDSLQVLLKAERVSLVSVSTTGVMTASSNSMHIDRSSPTVKAIELYASTHLENRPLTCSVSSADKGLGSREINDSGAKLLVGRTCLDYPGKRSGLRIVAEWSSENDMQEQMSLMAFWSGLFASSVQQHERILILPRWVRKLLGSKPSSSRKPTEAFRWIIATVVTLVLIYVAALPWPMTIHADATLEPVSQRSVFATADGTIDKILVTDGEHVATGQVLAVMHSPGLNLMAEEAIGKLRAMAEKRNGLMVAINQASLHSSSEATQTSLTSELLVLDAQEKHAKSMLEFVRSQQKELDLKSPIDGVVLASEIERELDQRPLKRGDALFKVVQLNDQWQLQIRVADRDSYWIRCFYDSESNDVNVDNKEDNQKSNRVLVQFDSFPEKQFDAFITRVEKSSENHLGQGSFQFVTASIDSEVAKQFQMGSVARVTFFCGSESAWYVWFRPLVEFIQMRTGWLTRTASVNE